MKLPDFSDFKAFNLLKQQMGIPVGHICDFPFSVLPGRLTPELLGKLPSSETEISPSDLSFQKDGTLSFNNNRVLLYIRDVRGDAEPRFHIAHCQTLARMLAEGRAERYVVSTAVDGQFTVRRVRPDGKEQDSLETLDVCQNCLGSKASGYRWRGETESVG